MFITGLVFVLKFFVLLTAYSSEVGESVPTA